MSACMLYRSNVVRVMHGSMEAAASPACYTLADLSSPLAVSSLICWTLLFTNCLQAILLRVFCSIVSYVFPASKRIYRRCLYLNCAVEQSLLYEWSLNSVVVCLRGKLPSSSTSSYDGLYMLHCFNYTPLHASHDPPSINRAVLLAPLVHLAQPVYVWRSYDPSAPWA